jgi:hypothetical protein
MGAALTYARRYALFALVGIAGEDDLDAPDLNATQSTEEVRKTLRTSCIVMRPSSPKSAQSDLPRSRCRE